MNDDVPFLRAILARPDDDLPRLVYADFLEEHARWEACLACVSGDSRDDAVQKCPRCAGSGAVSEEADRAEFIRVQVALANGTVQERLPDPRQHTRQTASLGWESVGNCGKCRNCLLRRRERELLTAHPASWVPDAIHGLNRFFQEDFIGGQEIRFHRGFVAEVTLSWQDWTAHSAAILAACPIAHAKDGLVRLTDRPRYQAAVNADGSVECWIVGRHSKRRVVSAADRPAAEAKGYAAWWAEQEWPGVRFELPAAPRTRRVGFDPAQPGGDGTVTGTLTWEPNAREWLVTHNRTTA